MPNQQLARGLWAQFATQENPFGVANGMEQNLRHIDDHLALYTLLPPQAPGTPLPGDPFDGDGHAYTDGSYATFNGGTWCTYAPRRGIRVVLANGTDSWLNTGTGWEQFSVVDTAPAVQAAVAAATGVAEAEITPLMQEAQAARDEAVPAASAAQAARVGAEVARDAALIQAGVFVDEPTGRAAVADGVAFKVQGAGTVAAYEYRRINATTVSTLIAAYPASEYMRQVDQRLTQRIEVVDRNLADYTGTSDLIPLYTDVDGRVLFGVYRSTGKIFAHGSLTEERVRNLFAEFGFAKYTGSGPVYPLATDASMRVVLGVDKETGLLVGSGLDSIKTAVQADRNPLTSAIVTKSKNHLLFYGQSLSVGASAGSVLSTAQPYSNITFNGGPRAWNGADWDFSAFKPLVEDEVSPAPDGATTRKETACSGAANYASTLMALDGNNPSSHVVLASTAGHGGYRIDQLNKASAWYTNFLAHVSGAHALDANHAVHAIGWLQGENDISYPTSYATYRAALSQLQSDAETDIKAITGQTHPAYLITYQVSWGVTGNSGIALAQLDLAQKNSKIFLATPTYHLPYASDNIHLTAIGYKWIGAYFGRAYKALVDGYEPQWLNPRSATVRGAEVRVRFDIPVSPMVLDRTNLAATTNSGFSVMDGAAAATISSIKVDGQDVVITLSATPAGAVKVRYALDYLGTGLALTNGASGNLRDSSPDVIKISGVDRPLWNVCPSFEMSAIKLGE